MNTFDKIRLTVNKNVFYNIFENPCKGFGFTVKLHEKKLFEICIEIFDYLIKC